ncbi:omega-hydroxypalmitate O-feruloyl transferase-like [Magnolia sinica]|uniref:omega-hydroxypalmitate O-feruloyl transferase-like n=1 Tax=Magnolia sinica TaxID=86752 RepID=UPI0026585C42|nr:omega-hydroxypalmitate O-feruloyl transferase-like [Magnolia sinica]
MNELIHDCQKNHKFQQREHRKFLALMLFIQVTRFKCRGFIFGLATNHCMCDGLGAIGFVSSWGETAPGLPLCVTPSLDRSILKARDHTKIEFPHHEFTKIENVSDTTNLYQDKVRDKSCLDPEKLVQLKQMALKDKALGKCTTFQALSAFVWRARCKALKLRPEQQNRLLFTVDGWPRLNPPLSKFFFGNGIVLMNSLCIASELLDMPFSFTVVLVQKAVSMVTYSYIRSAVEYFEAKIYPPSLSSTLLITTWSKLSLLLFFSPSYLL